MRSHTSFNTSNPPKSTPTPTTVTTVPAPRIEVVPDSYHRQTFNHTAAGTMDSFLVRLTAPGCTCLGHMAEAGVGLETLRIGVDPYTLGVTITVWHTPTCAYTQNTAIPNSGAPPP